MGRARDLANFGSNGRINGNIGVNVDPTAPLHVESPDNSDIMRMTVTGNEMWAFRGASGTGSNDYVSFGIHNNGTQAVEFHETGIVKNPNQPCFHAYPATTTTVLNTTNATWEKLPFDATAWDVGNNFNTTNKRFTAPVTGMYLMNWMFQIENPNLIVWMYAYPIVNGSQAMNRPKGVVFADFRVFEDYHAESGSWIMKLSANDYVEMHAIMSASGSTKNFKEESFWSGYLLG